MSSKACKWPLMTPLMTFDCELFNQGLWRTLWNLQSIFLHFYFKKYEFQFWDNLFLTGTISNLFREKIEFNKNKLWHFWGMCLWLVIEKSPYQIAEICLTPVFMKRTFVLHKNPLDRRASVLREKVIVYRHILGVI